MINKINENKLMESFFTMMPYFKHYLGEDLGFTISNTETFLLVEDTEHLRINFKAGDPIPKDSAADVCLKEKKLYILLFQKKYLVFQ